MQGVDSEVKCLRTCEFNEVAKDGSSLFCI